MRFLLCFLAFFLTTPALACSEITTSMSDSSGRISVTCDDETRRPGPGGGYLLSGFDLKFANGDHKPRTFAIIHPTSSLTELVRAQGLDLDAQGGATQDLIGVALADPDGEDPLDVVLRYEPHNQPIEILQVGRRNCQGTCVLGLSQGLGLRENELIIQGFAFLRDEGFDDNLREVSIDYGCPDDREGLCHFDVTYRDNDTRETFDVIIQFSILPPVAVLDRKTIMHEGADDADLTRLYRGLFRTFEDNLAVGISGFKLRYRDDDHFVGRVAILPDGSERIAVVLRDGDNDASVPPVEYRVDLAGITRSWLGRSP